MKLRSNKFKERISFIFFVSTHFISTVWINFFYISARNVDFNKYYDYINYFIGAEVDIKYGQSPFYYYLIAKNFETKLEFITPINLELILSYSVQNINSIFYIIGLFGAYKFFKLHGFNNLNIFLALSVFNFFPQSIYMRAVMKPEILAFSFLPWILYFLEKYKKDRDLRQLYYLIPFLLLAFSSKASIAGMLVLYLLVFYGKYLKTIPFKKLIILLLVFTIFLTIVYSESYQITSNLPYEREYDPSYDHKASYMNLFRFSLNTLFREPFFDYEEQINRYNINANSIVNLVLLDSFGDYFNQMFDFDLNYFYKNRKDVFTTTGESFVSENRVIRYNGPFGELLEKNLDKVRKVLSTILSILFFILLFYYILKDKGNRNIYAMPFIGILTLYMNSLGIPSNNFNPSLGDTFKTFYYSFFISITFIFIILKLLKSFKGVAIIFVPVWFVLIIFIAGHPKVVDQEFSEYLVTSNEFSSFCEINNLIFFDNNFVNTLHSSGNIKNILSDCNLKKVAQTKIDFIGAAGEECLIENKINKELSRYANCRNIIIQHLRSGYVDNTNTKMPYFSVITFIALLFLILLDNQKYKLGSLKVINNTKN